MGGVDVGGDEGEKVSSTFLFLHLAPNHIQRPEIDPPGIDSLAHKPQTLFASSEWSKCAF